MEKTILLIGLGQFGYHMAVKMKELKSQVLGIDIDEERVNNCLPYLTSAKIADSTDEAFLRTLGVRNFDVCVVTISGNFQASLETTALLKEYGAPFVLARACSQVHEKFLRRNGADDVVYPEKQMARWAAVRYSSEHIFDYIAMTREHSIFETQVPPSWVGKTIVELAVRQRYHINILAIKTGECMKFLPGPDHQFREGESIYILGENKDVQKFLK